MPTKYILVSGGVISGIGKGVIGTRLPSAPPPAEHRALSSVLDGLAPQDARTECYGHQD